MRNDKKKHINKHTFPNDIAEIIKPKPGMWPVFDSDSKPLMQRLKEARELIESGNLSEKKFSKNVTFLFLFCILILRA